MANLTRQGFYSIDLNQRDEVALLPDEWNGRFPRTNSGDRLKKLSEQQNHRCCYCGKHTWCKQHDEKGRWQDMATIEHIQARTNGGTNRKDNILMACSECNNRRDVSNPYIFMLEVNGRLDHLDLVPLCEPIDRTS